MSDFRQQQAFTIRTVTLMNTSVYELQPLAAPAGDVLRASGGITYTADSKPGFPCRQCLSDADVGDELLLVSFDPFNADSPYRSASPIFIHKNPCAPNPSTGLPAQLTSRQLSVRAFDRAAMMTNAAVIDGEALDETLREMFDDSSVTVVHVHNAVRGCWAVNVGRNHDANAVCRRSPQTVGSLCAWQPDRRGPERSASPC